MAVSESAISTTTSFLPWSSLLRDHVQEGPQTSNLQALYTAHQSAPDSKVQRCSGFVQARKAQESCLVKEHVEQAKELAKRKRKEEEEVCKVSGKLKVLLVDVAQQNTIAIPNFTSISALVMQINRSLL